MRGSDPRSGRPAGRREDTGDRLWTRAPGDPASAVPTATLEEHGIPSEAVIEFLDAAADAAIDLHSVQILRHGHQVAAGWWAPYRPDDLVLKYSLSKSVTSTCVGIAAAAGLLDVDDPARVFFPDEVSAGAGPRARALTVRHLLSMATGHETDTIGLIDPADPVRSFFSIEPDGPPGRLFTYNNGATMLLSAIVTEVTGQRLLDLAGARLLGPWGTAAAHWDRIGPYDAGFSGLHVDTDTIARLGLTYLNAGTFAGRRLLPGWWVREASAVQVPNAGRGATVDWQQGYGFQFWRSTHGYRGDGAYGQFCLVLPDQEVVLVTTGAIAEMQPVLDRIWRILVPSFADGPLPASPAAGALADRLAAAALPLGAAGPGDHHPAGSWSLRPSGEPAETLGIRSMRLAGAGEAWTLTLDEDRGPAGGVAVPVASRWSRSEVPVGDRVLRLAGAGSWTGPEHFVAQVVLINTPHRFLARCDVAGGRAESWWHTAPLSRHRLSDWALPVAAPPVAPPRTGGAE